MQIDIDAVLAGHRNLWDVGQLTGRQHQVAQEIVEAVRKIAESKPSDEDQSAEQTKMPRFVYLIDGARGSGKTHTLQFVQNMLRLLNTGGSQPAGVNSEQYRQGSASLRILGKETACDSSRYTERIDPASREAAVYVLPTIYPSDLAAADDPIEGIFAHLLSPLADAAKDSGANYERRERARRLADRCREIGQGWLFSNAIGADALLYNTTSYPDFAIQRGKLVQEAANRKENWTKFIFEFLEFFNARTLVVSFDDTDSHETVRLQFVEALRSYLDHRRIIVLMAGNFRSMRRALIEHSVSRLAQAKASANINESDFSGNWSEAVRREVAELLDKSFPPHNRFFLAEDGIGRASEDGDRGARADAKPLDRPDPCGQKSGSPPFRPEEGSTFDLEYSVPQQTDARLDKLCKRMMDTLRKEFIDAKRQAYDSFNKDFQERLTPEQARVLDNYVAWWLFRIWYRDALKPKSHRQAISFGAYFAPRAPDDGRARTKKRLSIVLLEQTQNHRLAEMFSDEDGNVMRWLQAQRLGSKWTGHRHFKINDVTYYRDTYPYDFLQFRMDIGLAQPMKITEESQIAAELLPRFAGSSDWPAFGSLSAHDQQLWGLGKLLRHPAVPSNLCYFQDLNVVPDVAFELIERAGSNKPASLWESGLSDRWTEVFRDVSAESAGAKVLHQLRRNVLPVLKERYRTTKSPRKANNILADRLKVARTMESEPSRNHRKRIFEQFLQNWGSDQIWSEDGWELHGLQSGALLADVRSAWTALRIFVHGIAKARAPTDKLPDSYNPDDDGASPTRSTQALLTMADRVEIPTLDVIGWGLKLAPPISRLLFDINDEDKPGKLGKPGEPEDQELASYVRKHAKEIRAYLKTLNHPGVQKNIFGYVQGGSDDDVLGAAIDKYRFMRKPRPWGLDKIHRDGFDRFFDCVDATAKDNGHSFFTRLSRHLLLLCNALSPCIPALAMLEMAAAATDKERAVVALRWRTFLLRMAMFVQRFGGEVRYARYVNERHKTVVRMMIPDFSWFSLFGDPEDFEGIYGLRPRRGLIRCALKHLLEAWDAIGDLENADWPANS